jgi:DNA invertase Pin-like site-specific DNA recombinase
MSRRNGNGNGKNGTAKEKPRCAIYTRKSTAMGLEQEFNSLDAQREACEAYIRSQAANGWQALDERYDDGGFTGANIDRPAFQRLLADIAAGRVDVVVVYKVDRLSRSLLDFATVMDRFGRAGVEFVSVTQNFSTSDSIGKLTLHLLMSFSSFERDMIAERTRDKMAAARRKGKWTGGSVPLGYEVKDKHLVINPVEAPLVRDVFDLYLDHKSTVAVARILNRDKRKTKRHRAGNGNVRGGERWNKNAVLRVLRNPVYAGHMPYGDELHDGEHEAIIERTTFDRAQAILETRKECGRRRGRNPEYLLTGILQCACGGSLTPASTRTRGKEYRYYRCVTRDKRGGEACNARSLPAQAIEEFVVQRLRESVATPEMAAQVEAELLEQVERTRVSLARQRRRLREHVPRKEQEYRRANEETLTAEGKAWTVAKERADFLAAELNDAEAQLRDVERMLATLDQAEIDGLWVARMLRDFNQVWDVMTVENRGRLVRALVRQVVVDDAAGTCEVELLDVTHAIPEVHGAESPTADDGLTSEQQVQP